MYLSCTIIVLKCHSYDREAIHLQNLGNGCNNACIVASQVYFSQIQQNACGEETGIISKNVADLEQGTVNMEHTLNGSQNLIINK